MPSQPGNDLIPTFYQAVADSPHVSWTYWTPYFATDLPYADVDSDSLPDVAVGRLPASTVAEVQAYTAKLGTWLVTTGGNLGNTTGLFTYAVNSGGIPAWPTAFAADSLTAAYPSGTQIQSAGYVRFQAGFGGPAWSDSIVGIANAAAGSTGMLTWNLNSSERYENTGFWQLRRDTDPISAPSTNRPFISLGLSCGMNNFDQTEQYDSLVAAPPLWQYFLPRRPLIERLLFEPDRGAIAQIGPTRASFIEGNPLIGAEFLERLYEPGSTVGRAFLLAQRLCMQRYPQYRDLFKSYVLLGDPRLGSATVTAASTAPPAPGVLLARPEPNPFNPVTRLRYYLGAATTASITIFDVQGRMVRRLVRESVRPAGWHEAMWDGATDSGVQVGSGVYFAQLRASGRRITQRLVLLK